MVAVSTVRFEVAADALVEELEDELVVEVLDVSAVVEDDEIDDKAVENEDELALEVTEDEAGCVEEPEVVLADDDDSEVVDLPPVVELSPEPGLDAR
jgi:hypothetical protein